MNDGYKGALKGQVALITGGAQGIGGAASTALARAGASVFLVARGQTAVDAKIAELQAEGLAADGCTCDVTDYEGMCEVAKRVVSTFGGLDIVYANAGVVLQRTSILKSDPERWKKTVEINMLGGYYTARACIPHMINRGGKIFFTGTGRGRHASANLSDYSVSKAGQWMLARCLAIELREYNICVNEIIPGPVNTALNWTPDGSEANADLLKSHEICREPDEIIDLLLFLATQSNSRGPTSQSYALNRREIQ